MGNDQGAEYQNPDAAPEDVAPAGATFGADLPVESVHGGTPARLGGFSPSPEQDTLPTPGSTDRFPKAPSGNAK